MRRLLQFLQEVRTEFGHITWPKKDALIELTVVVISLSVIISLILGGFDYLFTTGFGLLTSIRGVPAIPATTTPPPQTEATPSSSLIGTPGVTINLTPAAKTK